MIHTNICTKEISSNKRNESSVCRYTHTGTWVDISLKTIETKCHHLSFLIILWMERSHTHARVQGRVYFGETKQPGRRKWNERTFKSWKVCPRLRVPCWSRRLLFIYLYWHDPRACAYVSRWLNKKSKVLLKVHRSCTSCLALSDRFIR